MTAKKPVISTLVGGIQDFLVDYETGIVIPVHEPEEIRQNLLILKEDSSLREKLAESAYQAVLHDYTLTHMAERTKQVYEYLITRR
jgi:glycosyltransferase involved in cell wall biosynthesis